jgi:hypothetical protein
VIYNKREINASLKLAPMEVRTALAELDDPEDREDLIDALIVEKRIKEGKEETIPWEEVQRKLGL